MLYKHYSEYSNGAGVLLKNVQFAVTLEGENASDFERQNAIGKTTNSVPSQEENDTTHEKMMELEPL